MGALLDGELRDEGFSLALCEHLESCGACQGRFAELKRVKQVIKSLSAFEPSSVMREEFLLRLERADIPRVAALRPVLAFSSLVAIILVLVAGIYLFRSYDGSKAHIKEIPLSAVVERQETGTNQNELEDFVDYAYRVHKEATAEAESERYIGNANLRLVADSR